jgi:hypothetical protein
MKTFKSSKDVEIELRPVSQFKIDTLRSAKHDLPRPTYQAPVVGGGFQEIPLDEQIATNKGRLDEWHEYEAARAKQEADYAKKFLELMIWDGVSIAVPDIDSDWQKNSAYFGIEIPVNPIERKLFYVYNELLGTPADIGNLIAEIFTVSQIDEEAVAQLRNSFRSSVQKPTHRNGGKKQKPVASEPDLQYAGSDSLLAPLAK